MAPSEPPKQPTRADAVRGIFWLCVREVLEDDWTKTPNADERLRGEIEACATIRHADSKARLSTYWRAKEIVNDEQATTIAR